MAAGAMRTVRTAQLLRQTTTLARITALSVREVGQRRRQSTVADIHDAPQTGLQSGIQTGIELLARGGVDGRVAVGGTDADGTERWAHRALRDAHTAGATERGLASEGYTSPITFWAQVDLY